MRELQLLFFLLPLIGLAQNREYWIDRPIGEWPQIALVNHVQYKNGDQYIDPSFTYAGTGFLIDTGKDTLAATAKHVLWIAKNTSSETVQINKELERWVMTPKTNTRDSVVVDRLMNEDGNEILEGPRSTITERDWIVFTVKAASANLHPLKPRYTALEPDEKVYIPTCAYADSACSVYQGKLLRKEGMDLLIELNINKNLGGSSGSPVIDANGHLIGILSSGTQDQVTGKNVKVAVSTEYLYRVLYKKAGYNTPKEDYGELILKTVLEQGLEKAIKQFVDLKNDPQNYYRYNLRSSNKNGLRETGKKIDGSEPHTGSYRNIGTQCENEQ